MNIEKETQHDFPVSWEQLHRDAKALAWRLSEKGPWEKIVAITRGGLVPAAIVAETVERNSCSILPFNLLCFSNSAIHNITSFLERVSRNIG
mgnify:CR=1 FL=1